jgi:hypothetical protein
MPLWQEAPRGIGAATGLAGAGNGCCAHADEPSASDAARVAITTRGPGKGIDVTGMKMEGGRSFLQATGPVGHGALAP